MTIEVVNAVAQISVSKLAPLQARQPAKVSVSTSLLEKAVQLGIQIWSLAKTLAWLAKFRAKYGPHGHLRSSDSRAKSSQRTTRPLTAPCIKLESAAATTRPIFAELKSWPSLHFDGRPGSSPFSVPSSRQRNKKLAKRLDLQLEPSAVRRKEETVAKVKKTGGFCEICNTSFSSLEAHLVTELHAGFVTCKDNWEEVETSRTSRLSTLSCRSTSACSVTAAAGSSRASMRCPGPRPPL